MKKNALRKLFSFASACVIGLTAAGINSFAAGNGGTVKENDKVRIVKDEYGEFIFIDAPCPKQSAENGILSTQKKYADPSGDDFLERCRGQQWGYHHLTDYPTLTRLGSANTPKIIYDNLYKACADLWNNPNTIQSTTDPDYDCQIILTTEPVDIDWSKATDSDIDKIGSEVNRIYFMFRHDNAPFYFIGTAIIGRADGTLSVVLKDANYLNGATRASLQKAVKDYVKSTEQLVVNDYTRTDYQNAFELYKSVMNRMSYDHESVGTDKATAYNIIGGIVGKDNKDEGAANRLGLCEGYSRIFSLLLNYHGIDNIYVTGNAISKNRSEGHAWNMLKLDDGNYYFADATWDDDDTSSNETSTTYFAKGTETFNKNHELDSYSGSIAQPSRFDYLYSVPTVPTGNFLPSGDYRSTNCRLVDYNKDQQVNDLDLRTVQGLIASSGITDTQLGCFDLTKDSKMNNRDLKALQKIIEGYKNNS